MSYSNDYFLLQNHVSFVGNKFSGSHCKLCTSSYIFTGFHHLIHMYNKKYQVFHLRGYISLLVITRHIFSCSVNSETPLNFIQRIEPTHQPPRMVTGPNPDTPPGFPGWSHLVEFHCTIPRECTRDVTHAVSQYLNYVEKSTTYLSKCRS